MGHSNGRITAPVNTDDVSTVLGRASHDVKTLCMNEDKKINPWAKYKPEAFGGPSELTLAQRVENGFSLRPGTVYQSKQLLINAVRDEEFDYKWTYNAVGANDWGRLTDYDGYNDNATPPFGTLLPGTFYLSDSSSNRLVIPMTLPRFESTTGNDNGELSLRDFTDANSNYADWYVGLLLYNKNSIDEHLFVTKNKPIKEDSDWQIDFGHLSTSYQGLYIGIPILSNKQFTLNGSDPSAVKIISAGSPGVEITLATMSDALKVGIAVGYVSPGSKKVKYAVTIKNTFTTQKIVNNVVLSAAKTNTGTGSHTIKTFGNISIDAGKTWAADGEYDLPDSEYKFARINTSYTGLDSGWVVFTIAFQPIQTIK